MKLLSTAPAGTEDWTLNAMTVREPDELTLGYMSVHGLRYRVQEYTGSFPDSYQITGETIYEPDAELVEKYKDYFLG